MLSIHDSRWLEGFEPFNTKSTTTTSAVSSSTADSTAPRDGDDFEEFDPFASLSQPESNAICSSCKVTLDNTGREALIAHYKSDWHRHNVKRAAQGRRLFTEEEYEDTVEDDTQSLVSSDDEDDLLVRGLGSSRVFFVQRGTVFSLYSCILLPGETELTPLVFKRNLNCAIFLLAGGHFAGGLFRGGFLIAHKTFHRYTVRAKQGGAQSANDGSKGAAHSAGAALRRSNERMLREEIKQLLNTWKRELFDTSLIFIRCASYQRSTFINEDSIISKEDQRIRSIPFATQRPTVDEILKTCERLSEVHSHGSKEDFVENLQKQKELAAKQKTAIQRRRKEISDLSILDDDSEEGVTRSKEDRVRKTDHIKPEVPVPEEVDLFPFISFDDRKKLYEWIRKEQVYNLREYINSMDNRQEIIRYLNERRFSPDTSTFLHMAARMDLRSSLYCLLSLGCDPSKKNDEHKVAYAVSANKNTKYVFVKYRKEQPNAWDWLKCYIPEPLSEETEAARAEKHKEKRKQRKEKQKEKKEECKKEEQEEAARQAFLALPEREKRARAAEARWNASSSQIQSNTNDRCCQCGNALPPVPFEYLDVKLCSPSCVAAHRASQIQ